jgi:hypothetical protein
MILFTVFAALAVASVDAAAAIEVGIEAGTGIVGIWFNGTKYFQTESVTLAAVFAVAVSATLDPTSSITFSATFSVTSSAALVAVDEIALLIGSVMIANEDGAR